MARRVDNEEDVFYTWQRWHRETRMMMCNASMMLWEDDDEIMMEGEANTTSIRLLRDGEGDDEEETLG